MANSLTEMALGSKPMKPKKMEDQRKHGIARHVIHHHHDGTHHIEVHPIGGGEPQHLGAADSGEVHDHIEGNLNGPPSEDELAQAQQGQMMPNAGRMAGM